MELPRALEQIAEIRAQAAKTDVYRGYRSVPVAASGVIGLLAAWFQPAWLAGDPNQFVLYWTIVAAVAGLIGASEILYNFVVHDDSLTRRRTLRVSGQFLPSVAAGALLSLGVMRFGPRTVALLPGLWALAFGMGIFASRPYLVRSSGWVALYFYSAGTLLLWTANSPTALSPWAVGGTFGIGQLLTAVVLYWNLERNDWQ